MSGAVESARPAAVGLLGAVVTALVMMGEGRNHALSFIVAAVVGFLVSLVLESTPEPFRRPVHAGVAVASITVLAVWIWLGVIAAVAAGLLVAPVVAALTARGSR